MVSLLPLRAWYVVPPGISVVVATVPLPWQTAVLPV